MKKITFILSLLISSFGFAQNVSTGVVQLGGPDFTVKFDVNGTTNLVTMTMVGPENIWLAVALDATSMGSSGADVIVFDSTGLKDRYLSGYSQPSVDATQNWSSPTITTNAGVSTVVATRDLNTGDTNDYVFTTINDTALPLLWAKGPSFNSAQKHATRGGTPSTLGTETIAVMPEFNVYPNPTLRELNVEFPASVQKASVSVLN